MVKLAHAKQAYLLVAAAVSVVCCMVLFGQNAGATPMPTHSPSGAPTGTFPDPVATSIPAGTTTRAVVQLSPGGVWLKAQSTIASVWVPMNTVENAGSVPVSLTILGGCDTGALSLGDYQGSVANTFFGIQDASGAWIASVNSDAVCNGVPSASRGNLSMNFNATAAIAADNHDGYYQYRFVAFAFGTELNRYLNAFVVDSNTANVYVGLANWTMNCDIATYPNSCPVPRNGQSLIYSSFYGTSASYGLRIPIYDTCRTTGAISFYDLDASDGSLAQNITIEMWRNGVKMQTTTPNGTVVDNLPHTAVVNWRPGIPGFLNAHTGQVYYGGNDNQYMDMPGGDPMFSNLGSFDPFVNYELRITGLNNDNAVQIRTNHSRCPLTQPVTCTALTVPASVAVGATFTATVTLRNNMVSNVPIGTAAAGYHLGVINAANQNPPDDPNEPPGGGNNSGQWYPFNSVSGLSAEYSFLWATDNQYYTRMPTGGIAAGTSRTFSFTATAPPTPVTNKFFGVRVLDRSGSRWMPQEAACDTTITVNGYPFTLTATPQPPTLDDLESPTTLTATTPISKTGTAPVVNGVATTREYFRNRGGVYDGVAGTITGGVNTGIGAALNANINISASPDNQLGSVSRAVPAVIAGDNICVRLTVTPATGTAGSNGNIASSSGSSVKVACRTVLNNPYLRVFGGDVFAGVGFGDNCQVVADADIITFAKQLTSGPNAGKWVGSGTQMGAYAGGTGTITQFATSMILNPASPALSAFSNTSGVSGNVFGGGYAASFCTDDYWADKLATTISTNVPVNTLVGQHQFAPNSTITTSGQITGKSVAVYVDGDVTIGSNITSSTTWATYEEIPLFYLVVRGNIYIRPNVTQLDGVYIAMPNETTAATSAVTGRIFTCSDNSAFTGPTAGVQAGTGAASCANKLTVNGVFAAKHINFLRTAGSLRDAGTVVPEPYTSGNIAEVFRYIPELYLGQPAIKERQTKGRFDSVVSLPPAL